MDFFDKEQLVDFLILSEENTQGNDNDEIYSFAEQSLNKKIKVQGNEYEDTTFISPTRNVVERLFSVTRAVLTDQRGNLTPFHFEMKLFLHINRELWDAGLTNELLIKEPVSE